MRCKKLIYLISSLVIYKIESAVQIASVEMMDGMIVVDVKSVSAAAAVPMAGLATEVAASGSSITTRGLKKLRDAVETKDIEKREETW